LLYSKECEYAIRALTYLSEHPNRRCLAKEIAEAEDVPYYFLSKILQNLARDGFLTSAKGPKGGFQLASPAQDVTLYDIRASVDGVGDLDACAAGLDKCNSQMPCPLHESFKPLRERIKAYLRETDLAAMAAAVARKRELLSAGEGGLSTAEGG